MRGGALLLAMALPTTAATAEDLYRRGSWTAMGSDRKASAPGDLLTVVVYENAESSNATRSDTKRDTRFAGQATARSLDERAGLQFGGGYAGGGAVTRSDRLVAQITVSVTGVLPNGDLRVAGQQSMKLNGEATLIGIEGRVRPEDVNADNRVLSSRIADARVIYDGKGFVAGSARPGPIQRIFRFLGLG